jgi:hypothetical protein
MDELLRHDMRRNLRARNMLLACHLRLRALQNTVLCTRPAEEFALQRCDFGAWAEDLCAAADMLLHPLGRTVKFEAPPEFLEAACAPRDLAWLLLELICNCARHCHGSEIGVWLQCRRSGARRRPHACILTVACSGQISLRRLHDAVQRPGSGVAAAQRVANLHMGSLLWLERGGAAVASLRFPLHAANEQRLPLAESPDFVELLSDQLSLLYTALAPAVGAAEEFP